VDGEFNKNSGHQRRKAERGEVQLHMCAPKSPKESAASDASQAERHAVQECHLEGHRPGWLTGGRGQEGKVESGGPVSRVQKDEAGVGVDLGQSGSGNTRMQKWSITFEPFACPPPQMHGQRKNSEVWAEASEHWSR